MMEPLPPPDPELGTLLQQLRAMEPAPPEVRARARARLMGAAAVVGSGGGPAGVRAGRSVLSGKAAVAALAFLVGGVAGAGLYAMMRPTPAPRVVYVERPAAPRDAPTAAPPSPAPVAEPVPNPAAAGAPPLSAASVGTARTGSRVSQLSAERALLDEARAALSTGDPSQALDRLERHRRTFPAPILGEERDALRVEALAKEGHGDEARAAADAFRRRWPDSLFSSVVDDAIHSLH
jgi:hypothetical protein